MTRLFPFATRSRKHGRIADGVLSERLKLCTTNCSKKIAASRAKAIRRDIQ